jgi:hypothetical protein
MTNSFQPIEVEALEQAAELRGKREQGAALRGECAGCRVIQDGLADDHIIPA